MKTLDQVKQVYLIVCKGEAFPYIKIGKTVNLYNRIATIQTGCPYAISHVFTIQSDYEEEVLGLEKLLHRLLRPLRLRGEWYKGTAAFFDDLGTALTKINTGSFTWEEIDALPDVEAGPELEIMLHQHTFQFYHVAMPIRRTQVIGDRSSAVSLPAMLDQLIR